MHNVKNYRPLLSLLVAFLLINTQFAMVVMAQETGPPITAPDPATPVLDPADSGNPNTGDELTDLTGDIPNERIDTRSDTGIPVSRSGFACGQEVLDPKERQKFWDETLHKGFVGKEMSSGTPANKNREKTDQESLILPDKEGKLALKQKVPNEKMFPDELAHRLNKHITGAFAFGLEIDDSLRVGRCADVNASCALMGNAMSLRNGGAGIVANVKNVFSDLVSFTKPDDEKYQPPGMTEDEAAFVRAELIQASQDNNVLEAKVASRVVGKPISNSILAGSFKATMNSNCTNAACYINTYSMFDKLFNAYVSTDMLLGSFGPTLFNQAKKAFGYVGSRQPFFKIGDTALAKRIKSLYARPGGLYHRYVLNRQYRRVQQEALPFDNIIAEKKFVIQGGGFNAMWNGVIEKELVPKYTTKEAKGKVYDYIVSMKKMAKMWDLEAKLAQEELAAVARSGLKSTDPAMIQARIKAAGIMGNMYHEVDDATGLDIPEWVLNHKSLNWQKYAVKNVGSGEYVQPAVDSDFADIIFQKLHKSGHFHFDPDDIKAYKTTLENAGDKLVLYSPTAKGNMIAQVGRADIEGAATQGLHAGAFAKLDDGTLVPFQPQNVKYILKKSAGDVQLFGGGYEKVREISAQDMADVLLGPRVSWRTAAWSRNSDTMLQWAREHNWQFRKHYANLLDKAAAYEDQIIRTYLDPKGGLKWTAYPFAFWAGKRGFGSEDLSLYQLPDTWKSLEISLGSTRIYEDGFIDFFANDGSDQGDVFVAFLNKLPWKMVLNKVSETFNPVHDTFMSLTSGEMRNETGNLITYVSGPQDCPGCGITLSSQNLRTFNPNFHAPERLETFILEDTPADQKKIGQTLVAYTRHTDIKGQTDELESGGINLEEAIRKKETCTDKVAALNAHLPIVGSLLPDGAAIGGVLAFGENIGYALFTWGGFLGSVVQQVLIAPQLQDCVDTEEGYFVHFFSPAPEQAKGQEETGELGTEKVAELVKNGTDRVLDSLQGRDSTPAMSETPDGKLPQDGPPQASQTWTQNATDDLRDQIEELVQNAETKDLVEAVVTAEGPNTGQFTGMHLFYLWNQGGSEANPSKYRTEGKELVTDGNTIVENNFKDGKVRINGQDVITDPDIARMNAENLNIPAYEYPNRLTKIGLPTDSTEVIFVMDYRGDVKVLNLMVLDCIKAGVMEQTGVPLDSENLSEVFGPATAIVTDSHPNIHPDAIQRRITAEGTPRKIADGENATAEILANTFTLLSPVLGGTPDVGKMQSIQFTNGVIVYKPETNELIVWLKRNEKAILNQNDVAGLRATKTTSKNPLTNCDEPAINLDVSGNPNSEMSQYKAGLFNQSLEKMGPYKIFDTPTKRFIFYSKVENNACVPYFKVIDKATGETLVDQPITSIEQTPTGVKVTTADGKDHTLDFSSENGRPILSYNGRPETLTSAQGENGAFWYDPEKGLWYTENAQLLPLLEAFKKSGISTQVGPDGRVTSQASGNVLNLNVGGDNGLGFNLPSLPEQPLMLALFVCGLIGILFVIRMREIEID